IATGSWGGLAGLIPARFKKADGRDKKLKKRIAEVEQVAPASEDLQADIVETDNEQEEGVSDERGGEKLQDSGGSYRASLRRVRRRPKGSRGRRPKRR
ncbi:MAG: hypothetical protein MUO90_01200, partial [Dehalococcoidales bacterium]|nr:hypothetical protein [Dehalococcoidales bacterium]